jgi:ArsR family transcriptional regulator
MRILCDSGVVVGRKEGKWMHYSISTEGARYAESCLKALTTLDCECTNELCCEK